MSAVFLPKKPAFSALRPSKPKWTKVNSTLSNKLRGWLGMDGSLYQMNSPTDTIKGFYWLKGTPDLFIKIIEKEHAPLQLRAGKMAYWLEQQGIPTSPPIEKFTKDLTEQNLVLFAYHHIQGQFSNDSNENLALLGANLNRLHHCLIDNPWKAEIRQNGLEKHQLLVQQLEKVKTIERVKSVPNKIYKLLKNFPTANLNLLIENPSCLHGDLNYGNVIFEKGQQKVIFLDFEDCWSAWLNPLADIGFLIERFVLMKSDKSSLMLAKSFIKAYQKNGEKVFKKENDLINILQALAIRALLFLTIATEGKENFVAKQEWDKFYSLFHQTISRSELLRKIGKIT